MYVSTYPVKVIISYLDLLLRLLLFQGVSGLVKRKTVRRQSTTTAAAAAQRLVVYDST